MPCKMFDMNYVVSQTSIKLVCRLCYPLMFVVQYYTSKPSGVKSVCYQYEVSRIIEHYYIILLPCRISDVIMLQMYNEYSIL